MGDDLRARPNSFLLRAAFALNLGEPSQNNLPHLEGISPKRGGEAACRTHLDVDAGSQELPRVGLVHDAEEPHRQDR